MDFSSLKSMKKYKTYQDLIVVVYRYNEEKKDVNKLKTRYLYFVREDKEKNDVKFVMKTWEIIRQTF